MVLVVDAEQAARRGRRAERQRHVGDEVVVGAELLLLVGAGLLRRGCTRRAGPDRVALARAAPARVAGGDVMLRRGAPICGRQRRRSRCLLCVPVECATLTELNRPNAPAAATSFSIVRRR